MSALEDKSLLIYDPQSEDAAVELFRTLSRLKTGGAQVRALVDSSCRYRKTREDGGAPGTVSGLDEIGEAAENGDITLITSPSGFTEIEEISERDMIAVCGGGVSLEALDNALREKGLYFPVGEPLYGGLTIAQLIDDGYVSDVERAYGGLREYILSSDIVTPEGEVLSPGSRAIKDVTGYDMIGFFFGAFGRCGLLTRVIVRLLPRYEERSRIVYMGKVGELKKRAARVNAETGSARMAIYYGGEGPEEDHEASLSIIVEAGSAKELERVNERIVEVAGNGEGGSFGAGRESLSGRNVIEGLFKGSTAAEAVIIISFDASRNIDAPLSGMAWRTLYPDRYYYIFPCFKGTAVGDIRSWQVARFIRENWSRIPRLRVECAVSRTGEAEKAPVGMYRLIELLFMREGAEGTEISSVIERTISGDIYADGGFYHTRESALLRHGDSGSAESRLEAGLFSLFDPAGIILER